MDPITTSAASGIDQLIELAPIISVLVLVILGGYIVSRRIIDQCEKREERAIANWEKANDRHVEALNKNSEAFNGVQIALAKIETRIEK
jgi:hypothetical protein